jgi:hypothetical protein
VHGRRFRRCAIQGAGWHDYRRGLARGGAILGGDDDTRFFFGEIGIGTS